MIEAILGHMTHAANLHRLLPTQDILDATVCDLPFEVTGLGRKVPIYRSEWTVRSAMLARRAIAAMYEHGELDGLFIHTQVPAVLVRRWMRKLPTVVSLDATPLQIDELGEHYAHRRDNHYVEQAKWSAYRACFGRAVHIVTWSNWTKAGVVSGYDVEPDKVTVIPPGVTLSLWRGRNGTRRSDQGLVRILFVGGDLDRKGGHSLLRSFRRLRDEQIAKGREPRVELHLVTTEAVADQPGVTVHRELTPNSRALIDLYHRCDVFCLPTKGDCLPMVLSEAAAAGLPLVSTSVAAIPEIVRDGETGLTVPVGDELALTATLRRLIDDAELRARLGANARSLAERSYDAERNVRELARVVAATTRRRVSHDG